MCAEEGILLKVLGREAIYEPGNKVLICLSSASITSSSRCCCISLAYVKLPWMEVPESDVALNTMGLAHDAGSSN